MVASMGMYQLLIAAQIPAEAERQSLRVFRLIDRAKARLVMRTLSGLLPIILSWGLASAEAAPPPLFAQPAGVVAQAPQTAPAPGTPPVATISQPVTVQAGTGVLLRLPQPAATVMSAEPSIARVQPASPTSLFLMGVAPGRTTVIATTDAGQAIVQYDVTVASGATGGAGPSAAAVPAGTITPAIASAIQATIARTVQGASAVRVQGAGADAVLTGTVPSATAAQQAEAIARGYVGDRGGVVDNLTVLGAIQVNVRVRIAEINRSVTRQLGFNWQALGSGNGWRFGLRTGAAVAGTISPLLPLGLPPLSVRIQERGRRRRQQLMSNGNFCGMVAA